MSYAAKRRRYIEDGELGERLIRAIGIFQAANIWQRRKNDGEIDIEGVLGLADEFVDYVLGDEERPDDAKLIARIRGK